MHEGIHMELPTITGLVVTVFLLATLSAPVLADTRTAALNGFEETPAISTAGVGQFKATISNDGTSIAYELSYSGIEGGAVSAAHIHLGQVGVAGGVMAFLCGGGNKPACSASGPVAGTIIAADILGPAGQGIAAGEFAEAIRAIRFGKTYVNVHTAAFPGGEIRGQIK